jgi:CHAT domain-containing protein
MDCWAAQFAASDVRDDMPLVFLNACGTAIMDPAVASSFVKVFCDNNNRCIIATTSNVPDRIAASISRYFYQQLFTGVEVGSALHSAKWRLLQDHRNPLGIVYCIYASAGLRMLPIAP